MEEELKKVGLSKQPYWSTKYLKNVKELSKPVYKIREERDVHVTVRDGVKLCMDVFRPDVEGEKFPALVAWSTYGKSQQSLRRLPRPYGSLMFDHSIEAGDIDFWVTRGYVFVIPDPRGIGKSEGEWNGMYSLQEQEDCYDVIEKVAQRPWCDGNIGMIGFSYFGFIQPIVAALQPPHLKAIMPIHVGDSFYLHAYPGGILTDYYFRFLTLNQPNNPVSEAEKSYTAEELKFKINERLEDPFIRSNSNFVKTLETWPPRFNTWFLDLLLHPLDGPFWKVRSEQTIRDKIKIPVCGVIELMDGVGSTPYISGVFKMFADPKLNVPKKVFVAGRRLKCPYRFSSEEMLRWYDHWFKGIDTGIMDEPPIKIFVMGVNRYRYEKEWPLSRTRWTKLYLQRYKKLDTEPERDEDIPPDILVHEPPTISLATDTPSCRYATEPLTRPIEVTGPVALNLYAAIDVEDANFIAKLWDVSPNGERPISSGTLRASHRTLVEERSKPWLPVHDHTNSVPVKPGQVEEYAIEMTVTSNVFQLGHRIELEIKTMDPSPDSTSVGPIPSPWVTIYRIYRDAKYQSHLMLPVIPETPPELWID